MSDEKLHIEAWPIEKLIPYPDNAKIHTDEQTASLARVIARWGWDQPIVVDRDGVIIKGHGRRLAAIKLGFKEVPVLCRRDLTKVEAQALRISDNSVVSTSYNKDLLKKELSDLKLDVSVDLKDLGFTGKELEFLSVDLGSMNLDVFVDDVTGAVDNQRKENEAKVAEVDKSMLPVAEAIGFKKVSPELARRLRAFMCRMEVETKRKGVEALDAFLSTAGF